MTSTIAPVPALSIVTTLYRSADFIDEFLSRISKAAQSVARDYEIILVDDGSPDDSLNRAISHAREDSKIVILELTRNFGHHAAILTGLEHARGDRVFFVDSDLEDEPELLSAFSRIMDHDLECDVVYGVHDQVAGSRFRQWSSGTFWKLFNLLSETKTDENICHVRLMKRDYLAALLSMPERNLFIGGMYVWPGYKQTPVKTTRVINRSISTYNIFMRIGLLTRSLVAFSIRPLQLVFLTGVVIAGLSAIVAVSTFVYRISVGHQMLAGFASLLISIWFLSGLIIMSLGIIGLYLGQVYVEVKGRPRALVRNIHAFPQDSGL